MHSVGGLVNVASSTLTALRFPALFFLALVDAAAPDGPRASGDDIPADRARGAGPR